MISALTNELNYLWVRRHFTNDRNEQTLNRYLSTRNKLVEYYLSNYKNQTLHIDEVSNSIGLNEIKKIIKHNKPFIVRGFAKQWSAVEKWDFEYFIDHYGEVKIPLFDEIKQVSKPNHIMRYEKLGDILTLIKEGKSQEYPRFLNLINEFQELRADLDEKTLIQLRTPLGLYKFFQLFIGYKGSRSKMHAAADHNFFIQIHGTKKWIIYPPSFNHLLNPNIDGTPYFTSDFDFYDTAANNYQFMDNLPFYEVTLEPGDLLFNPAFFWHDVSNITPSIGLGFRWYHPIDTIKLDLIKTILTICCYNPPIWTVQKFRKDALKYYLLKSKLLD